MNGSGCCSGRGSEPVSASAATGSTASWTRLLAAALNNIGAFHHSLGRRSSALRHYQQAVRVRMDALREDAETEALRQRGAFGPLPSTLQEQATLALAEEERLRLEREESGPTHLLCALDLYTDVKTTASEEEPQVIMRSEPLKIAHGRHHSLDDAPNQVCPMSDRNQGSSSFSDPNDNRDSAITLFNMAYCHFQSGSHEKSSSLFDTALSLVSAESDPALAALILNSVAHLQYREGLAAQAMQTSTQAMSLLRLVLSDSNAEPGSTSSVVDAEKCIASTLSLMGKIHYTYGEPSKALELCREVLRLHRGTVGDDHLDVSCALYNIGIVLEKCGQLDDAVDHCRQFAEHVMRLISVDESGDGAQYALPMLVKAQIGTALYNIGSIHLDNHSVTLAVFFFKKSLALRRSVLGADHILVSETFYKLGEIMSEIGTFHQAMDYYRESVRIYKICQGPDSKDVAAVLCSMGQVYHDRGELDEALAVYGEVLRISRAAYGQDDEFMANMLEIIGNIYLEQGETALAIRSFADATRIMHHAQQRLSSSPGSSSQLIVVPMVMHSFGIGFHTCAAAA